MPEFQHVKQPFFFPTQCRNCLAHKDPGGFIDLGVDTPNGGRIYLCATCVVQAGRLVGMVPKSREDELVTAVGKYAEQLADADAALKDAGGIQVVPLDTAVDLVAEVIRRRGGRPPKDPVAA